MILAPPVDRSYVWAAMPGPWYLSTDVRTRTSFWSMNRCLLRLSNMSGSCGERLSFFAYDRAMRTGQAQSPRGVIRTVISPPPQKPPPLTGLRRGVILWAPIMKADKIWALVLMGGGARGLAHVGVLRVLEKNGLVPDIVAGTSMGAVVAGRYAAGLTGAKMTEMLGGLNLTSYSNKPARPKLIKRQKNLFEYVMISDY